MNRKQKYDTLRAESVSEYPLLFRPILMHFAARYNGNTYADFASDYRVLVESNIRAMEDFNMDMVGLISDPYRETAAFGAKITFPAEEVPQCRENIIRTIEDVVQLKNPDVHKCERTLDRMKGAELFQKKLKGTVPVIGWVEGPLAEACDLVGVSDMLLKLMLDPEFSNRLLDKCLVTAKDFAKAQIEAGCDIIGIGDAICSQIDNITYDLNVKERHKELIDYIHELGGSVKLHICGDISHLLTSIKDLNVDILDLDWQIDMNKAYTILGPDVIRCGNINPVLIQEKDPDIIKEMAEELIEQEEGRKFILSGGCEISVLTPPQHLIALSEGRLK